jgi:nucleotide-binding universal stress UspA family protein
MTGIGIKHIIAPTDLSTDAAKAFSYAHYLAVRLEASVTLVTCIDTSLHVGTHGFVDESSIYLPETISIARERAHEEIANQSKLYFPDVTCKALVREAPRPTHRILIDYINQTPSELVVMSSHGRTGLSRAFLGSVTEQVMRHSLVPVLVVPVGGSD